MKRILAVKLLVDDKVVNRVITSVEEREDFMETEELKRRFFDREPVEIDIAEVDKKGELTAIMALQLLVKELEEKGM